MGSEAPKLPLLSVAPTESYGGMGMVTPPHLAASVPFRWEEEPGKPRPSCKPPLPTDPPTLMGALELPPRLLYASSEGPCVGRSLFHSSRFIRCREVSFDDSLRGLVVSKRWLLQADEKPVSWRKTGLGVGHKDAAVVDGGCGGDARNVMRKRSMMGLSKPRLHFWAAIYEAMKQVIPGPRRSTNGNSKS